MKQNKLSKHSQQAGKIIQLRFYAELNDYLPVQWQKISFDYPFSGKPLLKSIIQKLGVPLDEIDLILVNDKPVSLTYAIQDGDYCAIYPMFELFDISALTQVRKTPLRSPCFILDAHLGKLAKYLRMLGFDTDYADRITDEQIIEKSRLEKRTILSKDRGLLAQKAVIRGYFVKSTDPHEQIKEVMVKYDLARQINPLCRCLICNHHLQKIDKNKVLHRLPAQTSEIFNLFFICPHCDRVYWQGSHYQHMYAYCLELIENNS